LDTRKYHLVDSFRPESPEGCTRRPESDIASSDQWLLFPLREITQKYIAGARSDTLPWAMRYSDFGWIRATYPDMDEKTLSIGAEFAGSLHVSPSEYESQ
jgi:hypothetical protein